ncbi:Aste57867_12766 [Aphanomyces stellatus]|uniref:Aste57867_12766 protein n=1 Tax=Aphanomyces stellatus TaxID=120398 RepID=A0A485KWF3_9STRA|nr:hypothetical protein As57867_012718 [Aphanomyces stellatus]VFT89615.1 Aste57867_12766 [Aphanomyces stellatus]
MPSSTLSPASLPSLVVAPLTGHRRIGAFSHEELIYVEYLSEEFKAGRLEGIANGTSLRLWLAKQLNCAPMRLSKKFDKDSGMLGMVKFIGRPAALDAMPLAERVICAANLDELRRRLVAAVVRDTVGHKPLAHHLSKHNSSRPYSTRVAWCDCNDYDDVASWHQGTTRRMVESTSCVNVKVDDVIKVEGLPPQSPTCTTDYAALSDMTEHDVILTDQEIEWLELLVADSDFFVLHDDLERSTVVLSVDLLRPTGL